MPLVLKILLIVLAVVVVLLAILFVLGRKAQKKQSAQQQQMDAMAQNVTMLVIDKKKMKLKEAGLPAMVLEQAPRLMRNTKLPIVKAKVGPKIMTFISEASIFESIPVKKEVKAVVSGLYITSVKGIRGPLEQTNGKKKKGGLMARLRRKAEKAQQELDAANDNKSKKGGKSKK